MQSERPKQFLELAGRPVLVHSLERFVNWRPDMRLLLVAPEAWLDESRRVLEAAPGLQDRTVPVVAGGASRHASTIAGLAALEAEFAPSDASLVLFHDAARPLLSMDELDRLLAAFADPDAEAISLAAPLAETIVEADTLPGPIARTADRSRFFAVKTPQAARLSALRRMLALHEGAEVEYTDLLTWAEACGVEGRLAAAGPNNLKLTQPGDLPVLERLLGEG